MRLSSFTFLRFTVIFRFPQRLTSQKTESPHKRLCFSTWGTHCMSCFLPNNLGKENKTALKGAARLVIVCGRGSSEVDKLNFFETQEFLQMLSDVGSDNPCNVPSHSLSLWSQTEKVLLTRLGTQWWPSQLPQHRRLLLWTRPHDKDYQTPFHSKRKGEGHFPKEHYTLHTSEH